MKGGYVIMQEDKSPAFTETTLGRKGDRIPLAQLELLNEFSLWLVEAKLKITCLGQYHGFSVL